MRILLLSTFIYLIGVAVVLFVRPVLMFRPDGTWKEFGLQGDGLSPFPFWLFCISWAIVSFFLSSLLVKLSFGREKSTAAVAAVAAAVGVGPTAERDEDEGLKPLAPPASASQSKKKKEPKPGYYKLNTVATKKSGVPRYIYLGPELSDEVSSSSEED